MSLATASDKRSTSQVLDDFDTLNTTRWTHIDDGATGAPRFSPPPARPARWLSCATAAATNDYHGFAGPVLLECLANRPFRATIRFKITENSANSSHWYFGVTDNVSGSFLTDTTGAAPANYHGAVIYKKAAAASVLMESANGTTKTSPATQFAFVSGTVYELDIEFDPGDGTTGYFLFRINGGPDGDNNVFIKPQPIAFTGMVPMAVIFGIKASGGNAETILVDAAGWEQLR